MAKELPPAVKDLLILVVVFGLILGGLYAYTGVWPPAVIVESGSMMHRDEEVSYGRIGTIDPGDMVLVKRVNGADDVETWAAEGKERYGSAGDVIVYYPDGKRSLTVNGQEVDRTPIIHRAMAWVDVEQADGETRYRIPWDADTPCSDTGRRSADGAYCEWGREGITVAQFGVYNYKPSQSGFITKGDNPFSNPRSDQQSGLSQIVHPDWIQGKARGEIPWLGLIKLAISPKENERNPPDTWVKVLNAWAPKDLWVMLAVSLFVLVGVPVGYDAYKALDDKKKRNEARARAAEEADRNEPSTGSGDATGAPPGPTAGDPAAADDDARSP